MKLPEFDQAAIDKRFIAEVHRLHEAGAFTTFREWSTTMGALESLLAQIEKGRYHCNLKLLYNLVRNYPAADITWIMQGPAGTGRPEPAALPSRQRGRPVQKA